MMILVIKLADNGVKAEDNIIGLKEDIAMRLESVADILHIDVIEKETAYEQYPQEED
jgi:hypothetical protein